MYKDDLSRELYPNFTYQIEKKHFGMYTGLPRRFAPRNDVHALDCFAPRNESHASACLPSFALQNSQQYG